MCESPKSESDESDMTSESAQSVLRPYLVQVSPSWLFVPCGIVCCSSLIFEYLRILN